LRNQQQAAGPSYRPRGIRDSDGFIEIFNYELRKKVTLHFLCPNPSLGPLMNETENQNPEPESHEANGTIREYQQPDLTIHRLSRIIQTGSVVGDSGEPTTAGLG